MNGNRSLLSMLCLLVFINFIMFLFVVNVWYIRPGHYSHLSPRILASMQQYNHRDILGHQPEVPNFGYLQKATLKMNNTKQLVDSTKAQPYFSDNTHHLLNLFQKLQSGLRSIKRPALKNRRLDRIYNVWNITFNINKMNLCGKFGQPSSNFSNGDLSVIAMVNSAPANFDARNVIRNTWKKMFLQNGNARMVFFVGHAKNASIQELLEDENGKEGDIVQGEFYDDYYNLTLKSVLLLRWVNLHCPQTQFVFKVDDDVFVNVRKLFSTLDLNRTVKKTIFGRLARNWNPIRNRDSHYFVPKNNWTASIYPDFVAGPAYVMSGDVVPLLLRQVPSVPYFFLEDVYITGICAENAKITRRNHHGFRGTANPVNPCTYHQLVTAHRVSPMTMNETWHLLNNYGPEAKECWKETCAWNWFGICMGTKRTNVDFLENTLRNNVTQSGRY